VRCGRLSVSGCAVICLRTFAGIVAMRLAAVAGLHVELAAVGDPDATSAVDDALREFADSEILVFRDGRDARTCSTSRTGCGT
jgi:hypothetical protein